VIRKGVESKENLWLPGWEAKDCFIRERLAGWEESLLEGGAALCQKKALVQRQPGKRKGGPSRGKKTPPTKGGEISLPRGAVAFSSKKVDKGESATLPYLPKGKMETSAQRNAKKRQAELIR